MKYFYLGDDFMPGYVTHYIFGRDMYEKLNDPVSVSYTHLGKLE